MRICFILEHFYPHIGGGETFFKELTSQLARRGCDVRVITSNSGGVNGTVRYDGVQVHHLPWMSCFSHPLPARRDLYEPVRWSDVVHTATYTAAPVALSVSRKLNKPCVVTVYEALRHRWFWVDSNVFRASLFYLFERYVVRRRYSLYHAISLATKHDLTRLGVNDRAIITLYPGPRSGISHDDEERDRHSSSHSIFDAESPSKIFLYYGRPGKTKGIFILLKAIRKIVKELPRDFGFVFILSDDPASEKDRLKTLIERDGLSPTITVMDSLSEDDLLRVIKEAFCVIVPSITEGFGYTAAESARLGKAIISSDAGSLPEVVHGRALFFKNRNSDDLAEKILVATKNEFSTLPQKAFSWEVLTARLIRAYEELVVHSQKTAGSTEAERPNPSIAG
jgi:glycosyltransferase involved in cell wall biosynthesis